MWYLGDANQIVFNAVLKDGDTVLSFKPTDAFLKKEPILNALLANIQSAKGSDGFYTYAMVGSLKHPRFSPRRK